MSDSNQFLEQVDVQRNVCKIPFKLLVFEIFLSFINRNGIFQKQGRRIRIIVIFFKNLSRFPEKDRKKKTGFNMENYCY